MENPQKGRNNGTERANQSSISVEDHTRFRCRFLWLGEGGFWFQCTYNENLTHKHKLNLSAEQTFWTPSRDVRHSLRGFYSLKRNQL